jgi:hypothetical protein
MVIIFYPCLAGEHPIRSYEKICQCSSVLLHMLVPQGIIGLAVYKDPYVQKSSVVDAFCNLIKVFFDKPCLVFVFL